MTDIGFYPGYTKAYHDQTILASENEETDWIGLPRNLKNHSVLGYFAGAGTLELLYKLSPERTDDYGDYDYTLIAAGVVGDSPFNIGVYLIPAYFIKFKASETGLVNPITGLNMAFVQTGD